MAFLLVRPSEVGVEVRSEVWSLYLSVLIKGGMASVLIIQTKGAVFSATVSLRDRGVAYVPLSFSKRRHGYASQF